jgi:hypothetical protein
MLSNCEQQWRIIRVGVLERIEHSNRIRENQIQINLAFAVEVQEFLQEIQRLYYYYFPVEHNTPLPPGKLNYDKVAGNQFRQLITLI